MTYIECGRCDGAYDCFECNTKNCNTKDNLNKAFRCYTSNEITSMRASECGKKKCYVAFNFNKSEYAIKMPARM